MSDCGVLSQDYSDPSSRQPGTVGMRYDVSWNSAGVCLNRDQFLQVKMTSKMWEGDREDVGF